MRLAEFAILWSRSRPHTEEEQTLMLRAARLAGIGDDVAADYEELADHLNSQAGADALLLLEEACGGAARGWGLVQAEDYLTEAYEGAERDLDLILRGDAQWAELVCREVGADLAERGCEVSRGLAREEGVYTHLREARLVLGPEEAWHLVCEFAEAQL